MKSKQLFAESCRYWQARLNALCFVLAVCWHDLWNPNKSDEGNEL
jgi:hypothetical protein